MNAALRPAALCGALLALAACEGRQGESAPQAKTPALEPQAAVQQGPPPSPLGDGVGLTGAVGGLSGAVTAFQVRETATSFVVELASDVLFAFDSADLSPGAAEQLRRTAALVTPGDEKIEVVGHTDSVGEADYNLALSLRRAQAVIQWLSAEAGVPAARLAATGRGEAEPVAPNETASGADDPQGRTKNRRVVVVIPKPAGG